MTEPQRIEPTRDPDLSGYIGLYVAILNGEVIASAPTSVKVVRQLHEMGEPSTSARVHRVRPPSDVIDMGWMSLPGAW